MSRLIESVHIPKMELRVSLYTGIVNGILLLTPADCASPSMFAARQPFLSFPNAVFEHRSAVIYNAIKKQ